MLPLSLQQDDLFLLFWLPCKRWKEFQHSGWLDKPKHGQKKHLILKIVQNNKVFNLFQFNIFLGWVRRRQRKSSDCCYMMLHRARLTNSRKPFWWPHGSSPLCAQWCRWSTDLWLVCFSPPPPNLHFLHSQGSVGRGRGQEGGWRGYRSLVRGDEKESRSTHTQKRTLDVTLAFLWQCHFATWSRPFRTKTSQRCGKRAAGTQLHAWVSSWEKNMMESSSFF